MTTFCPPSFNIMHKVYCTKLAMCYLLMIMTYPFDVTLVLPCIYVLYAKPCLPWAPPSLAAGSGSDAHVSVAGASDSLLLAVTGGEAVWGSVGGPVGHSPVICGCFPVQQYTHTKRWQLCTSAQIVQETSNLHWRWQALTITSQTKHDYTIYKCVWSVAKPAPTQVIAVNIIMYLFLWNTINIKSYIKQCTYNTLYKLLCI